MTLYALDGHHPQIHQDTWVAPDANLIGKVVMEEGASSGNEEEVTVCLLMMGWETQ